MLPLPSPYPDELVGSMLARAQRQTGFGLKQLIHQTTGTYNTSHPATITAYPSVAGAFGLELKAFLDKHTHYPFATAFWRQEDRNNLTRKLVNPENRINVAFLSQNAGKTVHALRLCPECIAQDLGRYGESYWKRAHQLPGVSHCVEHQRPLRDTSISVANMLKAPPPHQVRQKCTCDPHLPHAKALKLAEVAQTALNGRWNFENPVLEYRRRAMSLGYGLNSSDIYSEVLVQDFHAFYGARFLESLGCGLQESGRPWVATLAGTLNTHWTALRHVLLLTFLEAQPTPSRNPRDHVTRKKPRHIDWAAMENHAIRTIKQRIQQHQKAGTRTTVEAMLRQAGMFGTFKHNKDRFTRLAELLTEFKASPQSERQTGRRPRTYR